MSITSQFYSQIFRENLQTTNMWDVTITRSTLTSSTMPSEPSIPLRYLAKTVNVPEYKLETETGGSGMKYYKSVARDMDFSVEFYETVSFAVFKFLTKWKNNVFDDVEKNFRNRIQLMDFVVLFGNDNNITHKFTLKSVLIKDIDEYSLDHESGDALLTKANFTCDELIVG